MRNHILTLLGILFIGTLYFQGKDSKLLIKEQGSRIKYLALGDSYTIGTSLPFAENYPSQLKERLQNDLKINVNLEVIATNGWRTDDLLNGINKTPTKPPYDLVTLLIGVNNQYQGKPFPKYKKEFSRLVDRALAFARGRTERVIVISIPDYAYTPYGQGLDHKTISREIDRYNNFARTKALEKNISFVNITDITRKGLDQPELVAKDKLHPSGKAYTRFVELLAPIVISKLKD